MSCYIPIQLFNIKYFGLGFKAARSSHHGSWCLPITAEGSAAVARHARAPRGQRGPSPSRALTHSFFKHVGGVTTKKNNGQESNNDYYKL